VQETNLRKRNLEVPAIDSGCLGPNFSYGRAPSKEDSIMLQ
jgi:hypothetical protein